MHGWDLAVRAFCPFHLVLVQFFSVGDCGLLRRKRGVALVEGDVGRKAGGNVF